MKLVLAAKHDIQGYDSWVKTVLRVYNNNWPSLKLILDAQAFNPAGTHTNMDMPSVYLQEPNVYELFIDNKKSAQSTIAFDNMMDLFMNNTKLGKDYLQNSFARNKQTTFLQDMEYWFNGSVKCDPDYDEYEMKHKKLNAQIISIVIRRQESIPEGIFYNRKQMMMPHPGKMYFIPLYSSTGNNFQAPTEYIIPESTMTAMETDNVSFQEPKGPFTRIKYVLQWLDANWDVNGTKLPHELHRQISHGNGMVKEELDHLHESTLR